MTLNEIVEEIKKHCRENPTHGNGCACLDQYIRAVREQTTVHDREVQRRVIAASPKLLDIVEQAYGIYRRMPNPAQLGDWNWPQLAADARAAIIQATGREPEL